MSSSKHVPRPGGQGRLWLMLHFRPQKYWNVPGISGAAASPGSCPRILECWNSNSLLPIFQKRHMRTRQGKEGWWAPRVLSSVCATILTWVILAPQESHPHMTLISHDPDLFLRLLMPLGSEYCSGRIGAAQPSFSCARTPTGQFMDCLPQVRPAPTHHGPID